MKMRILFLAGSLLFTFVAFSQSTDYTKWVSTYMLNGKPIATLRIPNGTADEKIRGDIYNAQWKLDRARELYEKGHGKDYSLEGQVHSPCTTIQRYDSSFPIHYYLNEAKAYSEAAEARTKKEAADNLARIKAKEDSARVQQLQEGYVWINVDTVWVWTKPDRKAPHIGELYRLSYVKAYEVEGKPDWVMIEFGDHSGYIPDAALAYEWGDMLLTDAEEADLKQGRYFHFVATPAYQSKLDRAEAAEERRLEAANAAPQRRYIRGPKGGCYYINARGNKVYVDHGYCR